MSRKVQVRPGSKISVRQIRSAIGREPSVRATLCALGLGRIGKESAHVASASVLGMVKKLGHLLDVREVK